MTNLLFDDVQNLYRIFRVVSAFTKDDGVID
jgi:hypothetical protein